MILLAADGCAVLVEPHPVVSFSDYTEIRRVPHDVIRERKTEEIELLRGGEERRKLILARHCIAWNVPRERYRERGMRGKRDALADEELVDHIPTVDVLLRGVLRDAEYFYEYRTIYYRIRVVVRYRTDEVDGDARYRARHVRGHVHLH